MNTLSLLVVGTLMVANFALLVINVVRAIMIQRRPFVDRAVVQGRVAEVFRGGAGLMVSYEYDGKPFKALQINKSVNRVQQPVTVGDTIDVHVNPYRPSNVTLTPRPVRDETGVLALVGLQLLLVGITVPLLFFLN